MSTHNIWFYGEISKIITKYPLYMFHWLNQLVHMASWQSKVLVVLPVHKMGSTFEPPHDKTNKMTVSPAKTQISLGIHPVWSVFVVRSVGS